jgi:hypothetical protein
MQVLVDDIAAAHTVSSLRAACELLNAAALHITTVSVTGRLPDPEGETLPILVIAQRLATEYHVAVQVDVEAERFEVRFRRASEGLRVGA